MTTVLTKQINVPPPDGATVTAGNNVSVPLGTNVTVVFTLTAQGQNLGPMGTGYAQERIQVLNPKNLTEVVQDSGWIIKPGEPGAQRFYLSMGTIVDVKRRTGQGQIYNSTAVGGVLATVKQQLRIVITDPCGVATPYPISPTFTVQTIKDAGGKYH